MANNDIRNAINSFDFDRARQLLREALKQNPTADTYYDASQVALNDTQRLDFLKKAVALDPFHQAANADLARLTSSNVATATPPVFNRPTPSPLSVASAMPNYQTTPLPSPIFSPEPSHSAASKARSISDDLLWALLWVVVTIVGAVLSWEALWQVGNSDFIRYNLSDQFWKLFSVSLSAGLVAGLLIGAGQSGMLKSHHKSAAWFGITFAAWLAAYLFFFLLAETKISLDAGVVFGLSGLVVGFIQWLVLRTVLRYAAWWMPVNAVTLALTYWVSDSFYGKGSSISTIWFNVFGVSIYALATAGLMFWLLRYPKKD